MTRPLSESCTTLNNQFIHAYLTFFLGKIPIFSPCPDPDPPPLGSPSMSASGPASPRPPGGIHRQHTHGSLEGVGMLKRHVVAHFKAEQLRIPNLPFPSLRNSVFFCNFNFCVKCSFISFGWLHGTCRVCKPLMAGTWAMLIS